jgi:hypothetical protein
LIAKLSRSSGFFTQLEQPDKQQELKLVEQQLLIKQLERKETQHDIKLPFG